MNTEISGRCWTCGDCMTLYQIIPENHWTMEKFDGEAMGNWVFENVEPGIANQPGGFKKLGYDIIIAGESFGCGIKSVEHPIAALKGAGIKLIIAESVSRYSYRNAINLALPILICPGISSGVSRGHQITADLLTGEIKNQTTRKTFTAYALSEFAFQMISAGGLLKYVERSANLQ